MGTPLKPKWAQPGQGSLADARRSRPSSSEGLHLAPRKGRRFLAGPATPAAWFTITTFVLGVLALTVAAFVNVLLLRALAARRRSKVPVTTQSSPQGD